MAENLNVKVDSSWCYANSADSCSKYGRLYQWAAVMGLDASYNSKLWSGNLPRQGICPSGWHIPSDTEWSTLATYVGGESTAGTKLKSTSGWLYSGSSGNGTDTYGFRAIQAGIRDDHGGFYYVGMYAYFWSSSEYVADVFSYGGMHAWYRDMGSAVDVLYRSDYLKEYAHSLRCLKD
jgi:uncharacterized protein (TIGR02145 family)